MAGASRVSRVVVLASVAGLTLAATMASGQSARGAAAVKTVKAAKAPPGVPGSLLAVAAVPHSTDAWATGAVGVGVDNDKYFELHLHHGHWTKVASPNLGGRYGNLGSIVATSPRSVWIGGARQQKHPSIQNFAAIWHWNGKRFVAAKLPRMAAGAYGISAMAASGPNNIWAVGAIFTASDIYVLLHWNGKKWSAVPFPDTDSDTPYAISTSGPDNAWAIMPGNVLIHWGGKTWTDDGTIPAQVQDPSGVATTGPKQVVISGTGENNTTGHELPEIFRFNGKTWTRARLAKNVPTNTALSRIVMQGKSGWVLGNHETAAGRNVTVILHTSGGLWSAQRAPKGTSYHLAAISAASAKRVVAVGGHLNADDVGLTYAYVFNGHSWKGVSTKP